MMRIKGTPSAEERAFSQTVLTEKCTSWCCLDERKLLNPMPHSPNTERPATDRATPSRAAQGFTLIELSIVLVIIGLIIATAGTISRGFLDSAERRQNQADLDEAKEAIFDYASRRSRLPCPGDDDCGTDIGDIPANEIGLSNEGRDQYGRVLRYGVHQDSDNRVDLTDRDLYRNLGELCLAVRNGAEVENGNGLRLNDANDTRIAFAVVTSGRSGSFGGENDSTGNSTLEDPNAVPEEGYDDLVSVVTFGQLASALDCRRAARDARIEFATGSTLRSGVVDDPYDDDEIRVDGGLRDEDAGEGYWWCVEDRTTGQDVDGSLEFIGQPDNDFGESAPIRDYTSDDRCDADPGDLVGWAEGEYLSVEEGDDNLPDESRLSFRVFVRDRASGSSNEPSERDQSAARTFTIPIEPNNANE